MLDSTLRRWYAPYLGSLAWFLHRRSIGATRLTALGLALGLGAALLAALGRWSPALALWLASRLLDGLDGTVARIEGPTARGGFLDIVADFTVYGAFVVGTAVAVPDSRLAAVVLLAAYYVSGSAFLAWSSLAGDRPADQGNDIDGRLPPSGLETGDDRSLRFVGGLAEGTETVIAYSVVCLLPHRAGTVFWVFAGMVGFTALQRIHFAVTHLGNRP